MKIKKSILKEAVREVKEAVREILLEGKQETILDYILDSRDYDLKKDKVLTKMEKVLGIKIPDWPEVEEKPFVGKLKKLIKKLPSSKIDALYKLMAG